VARYRHSQPQTSIVADPTPIVVPSRTMRSAISVLCFLGLVIAFPNSHGIPQNLNPPPEGVLRDDGAILLRPLDSIVLKFELEDGKLVRLTKLPLNTTEKDNVLRITVRRKGGVGTKLGPVSPIEDHLTVECSTGESISARCEYTTLAASRPESARLSGKKGKVEKKFRWGVSQVSISEIRVK